MQLTIDGGPKLDKNHKTLDEYSIKDGDFVTLEYSSSKKSNSNRVRKPKENITIQYTVMDDNN